MTFPCSSCKKECLSELLGTYFLVVLGPSSVIVASLFLNQNPVMALLFVAFSFGGTVATLITIFGKYSGAQINPAVTLALTLARLSRKSLLIPYITFQLLGGLFAGLTLWQVFGQLGNRTNLGSTQLAKGIYPTDGIMLEALGTFLLVFSAIFASAYIRGRAKQALLVGATLFGLIMFIGPYTGASFNPARSLGPSLASLYFSNQHVYWLGPLSGALLSGLAFRMIKNERKRSRSLCMC